jgi:hypothetical protein
LFDASKRRPELWGVLECSVVRIGDEFRNEFEETAASIIRRHARRRHSSSVRAPSSSRGQAVGSAAKSSTTARCAGPFAPGEQAQAPVSKLVVLGSERGALMPNLREALARHKNLLAAREPRASYAVAAE